MKKYFKYIAILWLAFISSQLYSARVKTGATKFRKLRNKSVALIEEIAENAVWGILPTVEQIKELTELTPHIPKHYKGKNYEAMIEVLKNLPKEALKGDPTKIPEAKKYMQEDLEIADVENGNSNENKKTKK